MGIDNTTNCRDCCDATKESTEMSNKYVGRATTPIPMLIEFGIDDLKEFPSDYPPSPTLASPMGYIYHLPQGSHCKLGASVGDDGCTWQAAPTVHMLVLTLDELNSNFDMTSHQDPITRRFTIPENSSLANIDTFKKIIA